MASNPGDVNTNHSLNLLEQMLFIPSPMMDSLHQCLTTQDFLTISHVCRKWKTYLVREDPSNHRFTWHPVLRTVSVPAHSRTQKQTTLSFRYGLMCSTVKRGQFPDEREFVSYDLRGEEMTRAFGELYLKECVTRIYLDGARVKSRGYSGIEKSILWIYQCDNLVELSLRWCADIWTGDFSEAFIAYPQRNGLLQRLKKILVWGSGSTPDLVRGNGPTKPIDYEASKRVYDEFMDKFETDVAWCPRELEENNVWRLYDKLTRNVCEKCGRNVEPNCLKCSLRNSCDVCLGYLCDECLVLGDASNVYPFDEATRLSSSTNTALTKTEDGQFNMLEFTCAIEGYCQWRNKKHYIHPSCAPISRLCSGCNVLLCESYPIQCSFCNAGSDCCRRRDLWCRECVMAVCGACGNCGNEGHKDEGNEEYQNRRVFINQRNTQDSSDDDD